MDNESLQPEIENAQKALKSALEKSREVNIDEIDTGELIRIEETLAVASRAAKEAVSLRLKRRNQRPTPTDQAREPSVAEARVFDDIRGKRWRAFAVYPSSATVQRAALPEAFRHGWLSFESADEMRRVAPVPENWQALSIDELQQLCFRAGSAPKRVNSLPTEPRT